MSDDPHPEPAHASLAAMSIAALGVVFGDIGTSPLYAMRECFSGAHSVGASHDAVLGLLSLIVWSLILVVSVKYVIYVLQADNGGEGGILALTALAVPSRDREGGRARRVLLIVGLFGAALLYGESIITPSISVLSAAEGLRAIAPSLERYVIPVALVVLAILFGVQRRGTHELGTIFGYVTGVWFLTLASLGIYQLVQEPRVLAALDPRWAVRHFANHGATGFLILGSVFLAVTGAESLYADLGHFGRKPIRLVWFVLALPSLLLNYFGQGALVLRDPSAASDLFFRAAPPSLVPALVILSTVATFIASQAVIAGAFSLSRQAVMMGYLPRMAVEHTSARTIGQIYVPIVNWVLMLGTMAMVLEFRSSSALAGAYGIGVTSTMVITTILAFRVARRRWGWPLALAGGVTFVFLCADLAFLGANLTKVAEGGWVPLAVASGVLLLMTTWKTGRALLARRTADRTVTLSSFMADVRAGDGKAMFLSRVPGTAVYMSSTPDVVPLALMYSCRHHRVLHERVVILTIRTDDTPHVALAERAFVEPLGQGFWRVTGNYGFMESPDVPALLRTVAEIQPDLDVVVRETTFFLGQETILASERLPGMMVWREHVFAAMHRNAAKATSFFGLPPDRVVEIGAHIEL
jgi:KUP system potassium uptake protein